MADLKRVLAEGTTKRIGKKIKLQGWVNSIRDHGKLMFIDLRDRSGIVQCVGSDLPKVTSESVVEIAGEVSKRPEKLVNPKIPTGKVEVKIEKLKVLSLAKEVPIPLNTDGLDIDETMRLKYRYLDLRRKRMNKIVRLRSEVSKGARDYLHSQDFVEIETPMLTKSTREGARDFIVPSRHNPGKFYALPQAPQQYKQLLMVSGFEKYFQLARCIRDEDLRADRGYEHTQIDIEISFVDREGVMLLIENLVNNIAKKVGSKVKDVKFPVYDYKDAIEKFGADKFDLRDDSEKKKGVLAFAWVINFPFFKEVNKEDLAEVEDSTSGWTFTHNPFSNPIKRHLKQHLKGNNIGEIITDQYDLVCNGYEIGGGSIRANDPKVLKQTFRIMGFDDEKIEDSVGHMLKAFEYGAPPHGGIALGLDRLTMIIAGETSLKETIAFPMTSTGKTAVMDAPSDVSEEQLEELGIRMIEKDE